MKTQRGLSFLLLFSLAGCGTVWNLEKERVPFGGVSESIDAGKSRLQHVGEGKCIPPIYDYSAALYHFTIDLPLSVIGDIVSLPITIPSSIHRAH